MKANFSYLERVAGFEYENFIPRDDVVNTFHHKGNIIIQDQQGRLFDVHPVVSSRFNKKEKKNEKIPPSYPVRWQLLNSYDVPQEIASFVGF